MQSNAFFQSTPAGSPLRLELFTRVREPDEFHFYAQDVSFADIAPLISNELRALDVLLYRIPPALLNPNYWEPYSRETEAVIRDKMTGLITRQEGDTTFLWRSDTVSAGRILRDGLDVPVELMLGYALKTTGEGLLALGKAWAASEPSPRDRFEWIGYTSLPAEARLRDAVLGGHNDLTAFRFSVPGSRMAYAGSGDRRSRILFTSRPPLRRCVAAAIRGYTAKATGAIVSSPNDHVCDQILRATDGMGISSQSDRDFIDKNRSYEFAAHVGRTEWGQHPGDVSLAEGAKLLVYYDRIAGLWAIAH